MSAPASTEQALADFLARCDPASPAGRDWYVQRPQPFAPWMSQALRGVPTAKILLVGQAGVGKSTELARLEDGLQEDFTLVRSPLDQILDLTVVGWHDILVLSALWRGRGGRSDSHVPLGVIPSPALSRLERDLVEGLSPAGTPPPTGVQAFRNDPKVVHERIESGRAQFWDRSVAALQEEGRPKPIALILDGLEKLPPHLMTRLFRDERRHLLDLPFRVVVTAPLGMSFQTYFGEVESDFLAVTRLRALSHRTQEPGFRFLRELADKRGAVEVLSGPLLEESISWSGGLPRQLLQLLAAAATQAMMDGLLRVERESFLRARRKVSERWQYQLEPADYVSLAKPDEERTTTERARLLALGALLEYDQPDGGLGLGMNPLVGALLKERRPDRSVGPSP